MRRVRASLFLLSAIGVTLRNAPGAADPPLPRAQAEADAPRPHGHLTGAELASLDAAVERGARWLLTRQDERGAFPGAAASAVPDVALTAVALWALAPVPAVPQKPLAAATDFILAHRQQDGGIYDPRSALRTYTSGVAARALQALPPSEAARAGDAARAAELFVYRKGVPESLVDLDAAPDPKAAGSAEAAARLLGDSRELTDAQRRTLEFLARGGEPPHRSPLRTRQPLWKAPGAGVGDFSYDDLLPIVYLPLSREQQIVLRALEAVRRDFDLEHNPDLTRRYGPAGFQSGTEGLYYYYLVLARTLSIGAGPSLVTEDGRRRDWVRELARKLVSLQRADGRWVNDDPHWCESDPVLVTSYALIALSICRDVPEPPAGR